MLLRLTYIASLATLCIGSSQGARYKDNYYTTHDASRQGGRRVRRNRSGGESYVSMASGKSCSRMSSSVEIDDEGERVHLETAMFREEETSAGEVTELQLPTYEQIRDRRMELEREQARAKVDKKTKKPSRAARKKAREQKKYKATRARIEKERRESKHSSKNRSRGTGYRRGSRASRASGSRAAGSRASRRGSRASKFSSSIGSRDSRSSRGGRVRKAKECKLEEMNFEAPPSEEPTSEGRTPEQKKRDEVNTRLKALDINRMTQAALSWYCSNCGKWNDYDKVNCFHCTDPLRPDWDCINAMCEATVHAVMTECDKCGRKKTEIPKTHPMRTQ